MIGRGVAARGLLVALLLLGVFARGGSPAIGEECLRTLTIANGFPGEITLQLAGPGTFNMYKIPGGATNRIKVGGACVKATVRGRVPVGGVKTTATTRGYETQKSSYDYANRLKERDAKGKYTATATAPKAPPTAADAAAEIASAVAGASAKSAVCENCGAASQPSSQPSGGGDIALRLPEILYPTSQPASDAGDGGGVAGPGGQGVLVTDQADLCGVTSGQPIMIANNLVAITVEGGACGHDCGCGLMFCSCEDAYACAGEGRDLLMDPGDGNIAQVRACGGPIEAPTVCECGHRQCGCATDNACRGAYIGVYGVGSDGIHRLERFCRGPESERCEEEGAWRRKAGGQSQNCSFEAPKVGSPNIRLEPEVPYGEQADENLRNALGNMAGLLSNIMSLRTAVASAANVAGRATGAGDVAGTGGALAGEAAGWDIPTSPGEVPAAAASNMLRMGQRVADAADRWARDRGNTNVTVIAEVPMERISTNCVEIENCQNGAWTPGGFWPTGTRREDLATRTHSEGPVSIHSGASGRRELETALGRIQNWWIANRFDEMARRVELFNASTDPCRAACEGQSGAVTPPPPDEGGGRNCARILEEIRIARAELARAQNSLAEHQRELTRNRAALAAHPEVCRQRQSALDEAVEDARAVWRRAVAAERLLYADAPGPTATEADRARHDRRVADAQAVTRTAEDALSRAQATADAARSLCEAEERELRDNVIFHQDMVTMQEREVTRLNALVERLLGEYRACLGQR